jgi:arginyl-tRNA synthetase
MESINIKAYTDDNSQIDALKAFMKALKIKFEVTKEKPYNPEFVAMIKQGEQDLKDRKGIAVTLEELEQLCK